MSCGLCELPVSEEKDVLVRYPNCGHMIHLSCYITMSDFLIYLKNCKVCMIEIRLKEMKNKTKKKRGVMSGLQIGLSKPYPPNLRTDLEYIREGTAVLRESHSIPQVPVLDALVDDGLAVFHRQIVTSLVRTSLQTEMCSFTSTTQKEISRNPNLGRCFSFAQFIDTLNSEHRGTHLLIAKSQDGEGGGGDQFLQQNIGSVTHGLPKSSGSQHGQAAHIGKVLTLPNSICGIQPWAITRNASNSWLASELQNPKKDLSLHYLAREGYTTLDLIRTGIKLSELVEKKNYSVDQLVEFGVKWDGFIALGLTLVYFKKKMIFPIQNFLYNFKFLTVHALLLLPPENLSPSEKLEAFCDLDFSYSELYSLRFDIHELRSIITKRALISLSRTCSLDEMVDFLGLNGQLLIGKGLLSDSFFDAMKWSLPISAIAVKLGVSEFDIEITSSANASSSGAVPGNSVSSDVLSSFSEMSFSSDRLEKRRGGETQNGRSNQKREERGYFSESRFPTMIEGEFGSTNPKVTSSSSRYQLEPVGPQQPSRLGMTPQGIHMMRDRRAMPIRYDYNVFDPSVIASGGKPNSRGNSIFRAGDSENKRLLK